ncbi:MAG: methyltransferase family protein, partial [Candidatus Bathyarchaeia archaeon]
VLPLSIASMAIGGVLTSLGAVLCLRWLVFWRRNFRGKLITHGPYARVRHPFYSAFLFLAVGLAVLIPVFETVMLAVLSAAVIFIYVEREEAALLARYGEAYREYMRRVPWKLIPRVY